MEGVTDAAPDAHCDDSSAFFRVLSALGRVHAIKLYRLRLAESPAVPILPCLDHEAMLHEGIAPHASAYLEDAHGDFHEVTYIPRTQHIDIDVVSTMYDCSPDGRIRFRRALEAAFPSSHISVHPYSWWKGDKRVAAACRAQVSLRDVLTGGDIDETKRAVDRLSTISSLMEKESRAASWAARTVMTPLVAVVGFGTYQVLGYLGAQMQSEMVNVARYVTVSIVGGFFLYYGIKAVHLTEMANRVWKRSAEYGLILAERKRIGAQGSGIRD
jgi:hypothetical protein